MDPLESRISQNLCKNKASFNPLNNENNQTDEKEIDIPYTELEYINDNPELIQQLSCPLCKLPVNPDALRINTCGHVFCHDHLMEWLEEKEICPIDHKPIISEGFTKELLIPQAAGLLRIKCPYSNCSDAMDNDDDDIEKVNCNWVGVRDELKNHLMNECQSYIISCPNNNCFYSAQRSKVLKYHQKTCPWRSIMCPNKGCNALIYAKDIETHDSECPLKIIKCPNKGCNISVVRHEMQDHIWKCKYVKKDLDWIIQKCDYLQDLNIFQKKLIHELEEITKIQKEKIKFIQKKSENIPFYNLGWSLKLPTALNPKDKSKLLSLSNFNLRAKYINNDDMVPDLLDENSNNSVPALIRSNYPINKKYGLYYFEISILSVDIDNTVIGIGLTIKDNDLYMKMPGWTLNTYGYHSDNGQVYIESGSGVAYGPTFTVGDTIGCGIHIFNKTIFFTKNGKNLGNIPKQITITEDLYPTVSFNSGEIEANFGQKPFIFDIDSYFSILY
ncbi:SPRY-domain-containing protein, partial [Piromyces finnis]